MVAVRAQRTDAFVESRDRPSINYTKGPVNTAISDLNRRLEAGAVRLTFDPANGYLRSVLDALKVPVESQVTAFSRASAEADLISEKNPRALYFNDSVAVGWVRGSPELEIAAHDPRQGVIFYTLSQTRDGAPRFKRNDGCLECHLSWETLGVPGVMVLSTFPLQEKDAYASGLVADHRSTLLNRWGGWYVTGKAGSVAHMGNVPMYKNDAPTRKIGDKPPELTTLGGKFETSGYLSLHSDVVALMVLEHQTHMINLITRVGWESRLAGSVTPRVREAVGDLVDYLLFLDEAPLVGTFQGSSGFTEKFSAGSPRDGKGRSLRQLDLAGRLFRYPCSYLIYSDAFAALPVDVKTALYERMWQILSGRDTRKGLKRLALADRQAVVEILRDTKRDLPDYFQRPTQ